MGVEVILGITALLLLHGSVPFIMYDGQSSATGSVHIRADGLVEPATAPILNVGNFSYTFTDSLNDSLIVERNNIVLNGAGFTLHGTGSGTGIDLTGRSNVTIKGIRVTAFHYGIYLYGSTNSVVFNNTLTDNEWDGTFLLNSDGNLIYCNNFLSNKRYGIALSESGNNRILHNNFINNKNQTHLFQSFNNIWNDTYPSGGNYWSDYTDADLYSGPYQNETGSDGIGDAIHTLNIFNKDHYPLVASTYVFDAGICNHEACRVEILSNSSISNFKLNTTSNALCFDVSGETDQGFCRVTIPNVIVKNLWQSNITLLVDGEQSQSMRKWTDDTNTYVYFAYTEKEHEVVVILEFPSSLAIPLLIIFITLIVATTRRNQRYIRE